MVGGKISTGNVGWITSSGFKVFVFAVCASRIRGTASCSIEVLTGILLGGIVLGSFGGLFLFCLGSFGGLGGLDLGNLLH
tara:strand:+ start:220 stop:459 length:240 start_codon:yes stop_codon:yes gene_type:complete